MTTKIVFQVLNSANQPDGSRWLNCEEITGSINRNPSVLALPRTPASDNNSLSANRPKAWGIDFGMLQENIMLSGICADYESDPDVATIVWLAEVARAGWYGTQIGGEGIQGGVRLFVPIGPNQGGISIPSNVISGGMTDAQVYQGVVVQFTYSRTAGKNAWQWRMMVQVAKWPANMGIG